jgi:hypothetical protein
MPNHYHLLLFLKTGRFGREVMQPLMVSYTKAINKQEERVGPSQLSIAKRMTAAHNWIE